jgi:hypothetical protein
VGVEEEVVPALWREEQGGRVAVGRGRLVQYDRLLLTERRIWNEYDWGAGLELHVEVFDRMDGLQLLSARGALGCKVDERDDVQVYLKANLDVEVRGASFSAASRDPEQRRFANIGEYFSQGHRLEYACSLCVRVTVRDQRTGKGGLLWEEGKTTLRVLQDPIPVWENRLPEGAKEVISHESSMVGARAEGFGCWTAFHVCPEPDQEGVPDGDRLYHVAMAEDNSEGDAHPFTFLLTNTNTVKVGALIRSLC